MNDELYKLIETPFLCKRIAKEINELHEILSQREYPDEDFLGVLEESADIIDNEAEKLVASIIKALDRMAFLDPIRKYWDYEDEEEASDNAKI